MAHAIVTMLTKLSALRKFAKDSSLTKEAKQKIVDNLLILIEEDKEEENRQRREQEEQRRLVDEYRCLLDEKGITIEELRLLINTDYQPPKYCYYESGKLKTWSGRGKTPKAMKKLIESGRTLESFRINQKE